MKKGLLLMTVLIFTTLLISCGGGTSSSSSPPGVNTGIPSIVQLLPLQYVAQTNSSLYFKAKVLDGNGNPVANEPVTFTNLSPIGTISTLSSGAVTQSSSTVAYTDEYGYATARIFSHEPGFITVLAEVDVGTGKVRDRKTVFFTSSDTNIYLLPSMTLDVDSLEDGIQGVYNEATDFNLFETTYDDTVEVLATVYDRWGYPAAGVSITWGVDQAEAVFLEPINSTTNINGQAKALIKDVPLSLRDTETFLNVYAYADVGAYTVSYMVTLFLQPVSIDTTLTYLTADPPVVETGGESTITAVVYMNTGEPIFDGATINFTTSPKTPGTDPDPCGSITPFAQTTGGVAEATFTAPDTEGTCTITAAIRGTVIGTVDVGVRMALVVIPSQQTADNVAGETVTFTIRGGEPPYYINTSDLTYPPVPDVVTTSGGTFTVTVPPLSPTTVVRYTIVDSSLTNPASVIATLNIGTDTTGPSVIFTDPPDGATNVTLNSLITITWDEDVDCTTVNTTSVTVDTGGWALSSCSGDTAEFTTSGQVANTTYTVTVKKTITDVVGNPMTDDYVFSYTTAP